MGIALSVIFLVVSVLLIMLILIQKGRGAGLAGAFGGAGGHSAFGTKTADVLTKVTAGLAVAFFLLAIITAFYHKSAMAGRNQLGGSLPAQTAAAPEGSQPATSQAPTAPTPENQTPPPAPVPAPENPTPTAPPAPAGPAPTEKSGG